MNDKIEQLEESVRSMHYNPPVIKRNFDENTVKEFYQDFWHIHILPVMKYSKEMALKYGADQDVVCLGALLHDIAYLHDIEPHDEIGSVKAFEMLKAAGFDDEVAEKVRGVVLKHSCRDEHQPITLEEKIVATADAMAHLSAPFYEWVGRYSKKNFWDLIARDLEKVERDFNEKIFFEDEKAAVEGEYNVLKKWFSYKKV
jgi:putative nucleotidyltransferase with HDIG domain